jgi:N-acetylmuramoyl-L-alanine amidase
MNYISSFILILLLSPELYAELNIHVVYPRENQEIAMVDSTFIFGNVTPGTRLWINDSEIPVHKYGGWLAYIDISSGPYIFHLIAVNGSDTMWQELPVLVGSTQIVPPESTYLPREVSPGAVSAYQVGSLFTFTFQAPRNGTGWFFFDQGQPIKMSVGRQSTVTSPGEVFGTISKEADSGLTTYYGYCQFTEADTGIHRLCYMFKPDALSSVENPVIYEHCYDSVVTVVPRFPPVVGKLVGENNIIRTGPDLGYKLLYQPPGIMVQVIGMQDEYYRLSLAENVTGFVNVENVVLQPVGTPMPGGEISHIDIDRKDGGIKISSPIGARLPFEINETLNPPGLEVDIFGVTGDVDWIRYHLQSPLARIVRWSQPQDRIFRMSVEADYIWGYKAYYDSTKFVLELNGKPEKMRALSGPLNGARIVIDPGHSFDSGAIGPTGLKEKDANLWIAHELRLMLEKQGARVLMTRYGHEHIALYDRPEIAEKWDADILVSIHNNALPDGINPFANNGSSVYYYHPHSQPLAEAIHRRLLKRAGLPDHGLYYGNLVLTRYSSVPSVLVECAFMMIPEQEALLKTDKFQRKCARAIMEGISDFLKMKR